MTYPPPPPGPAGPPANPPAGPPAKKRRVGCLVAALVALVIAVPLVACGVGVWWWFFTGKSGQSGAVGQCFPAGPDGPLDTTHGTVACSHPNALWKITKEFDGPPPGRDVIAVCGPDGDMLIYRAEVDKSYCLEDIN